MSSVVVLLAASSASADREKPYRLSGEAGIRLGTAAIYPRAGGTVSKVWWDRMHLGLHLGFGAKPSFVVAEQAVEAGVWLYPSKSVSLLLGWRLGHVYIQDTVAGSRAAANAVDVETFAELSFDLGRLDIRVAPMIITGYWSNVWMFAIGPEVGVAAWF